MRKTGVLQPKMPSCGSWVLEGLQLNLTPFKKSAIITSVYSLSSIEQYDGSGSGQILINLSDPDINCPDPVPSFCNCHRNGKKSTAFLQEYFMFIIVSKLTAVLI